MEFEFTSSIYVDDIDFEEMCDLCLERDMTPQEALSHVSFGWDDSVFYNVGLVEDQIIAEIEKRLLTK